METTTAIFFRFHNQFLLFLFLSLFAQISFSQYEMKGFSESWQETCGSGLMNTTVVTKTDDLMNVYTVGSTIVGYNNSDILIQKRNDKGELLWEQLYAGEIDGNDFATDVYIDVNYDVYVTGTIVDTLSQENDLIVLKYNNNGIFQWKYTYNGSDINTFDLGVAITGDDTGTIYVAGTSGSDTTFQDCLTLAIDASNGSVVWSNRYDYNQLVEMPKRIFVLSNQVVVIGGGVYDDDSLSLGVFKLKINKISGLLENEVWGSINNISPLLSGTGGIDLDDIGNVYITGGLYNLPSYSRDVLLLKFDVDFQLVGQYSYDFDESDDGGKGIKLDDLGNIYITGYSNRQVAVLKIDADGVLIWKTKINVTTLGENQGVQLAIDDDKIYVLAKVYDEKSNNYNWGVYLLNQNGDVVSSVFYNGSNNLHDDPHSIDVDGQGDVIVTGRTQTGPLTYENKTIKYTFYQQSYEIVSNDTIPKHLSQNILVKFKKDQIKQTSIDKRNFVYGKLSDFIDSTCIATISDKIGEDWSEFPTSKVFRSMTTADSLSVTRLGDTIKTIDFWTTLSIDVPKHLNLFSTCDSLDSLYQYIEYSSPNYLYELYATPLDNLFPSQKGLYQNSTYPYADIDAEHAWDIEVGQSNVKVGILDSPFNWAHNEFNRGVVNIPGSTKKIGGGYNYYSNNPISVNDQNTTENHGASVAGIIGAKRNNYMPGNDSYPEGIAGIAGGDMRYENFGVQLFSLGISNQGLVSLSLAAEAMRDGYSDNPTNPKSLGLNIINASWGSSNYPGAPNVQLLEQSVDESWRNHCIFVAARGHSDIDPSSTLFDGNNPVTYPACFNDKKLITVAASGDEGSIVTNLNNDGEVTNWFSLTGRSGASNTTRCDVDVIAPGIGNLIMTTKANGYGTFNGTSAAAPHVTGTIALMYSQHQPVNNYPNKLVTEDVENILEKTAQDKGSTGFDWQNAYGLLDAYEAVRLVSDPYYVKHLSVSPTIIAELLPVIINIQQVAGFPNGNQTATRYKVEWDINEVLPAGHKIIDWWNVDAFVIGGETMGPNFMFGAGSAVFTNMPFDPIGGGEISRVGHTYAYKVSTSTGHYWFPRDPNTMKYGFSIHVLKDPDASLHSIKKDNFVLYPNPSKNNIKIHSKLESLVDKIQIFDISGRLVYQDEVKEKHQDVTIDISGFKMGMYYCKIISATESTSIPFLKSE